MPFHHFGKLSPLFLRHLVTGMDKERIICTSSIQILINGSSLMKIFNTSINMQREKRLMESVPFYFAALFA
jgi:hypothetical protein